MDEPEGDDDKADDADLTPGYGVVLRAKNGDVIRYDPSGLVLRLSDRVVADIALRLPDHGAAQGPDMSAPGGAPDLAPGTAPEPADPPDGVDGWNARRDGDWLRFTARLPGAQGLRDFRQSLDGGDIIADAPGPVLGILGLGGARAALANAGGAEFPYHVVAPADDIGAVGHAGVDRAADLDRFEQLREMTHEALVAQTILHWRLADYGPLPLFMARVETDAATTAAELASGRALENLLIAARNLRAGAAAMGRPARVLAVTLDFALEDRSASALAYRDGMLAVMEAVSAGLWALGFERPLFVARLESGRPDLAPQAALDGQWELGWNHGDHRLVHSAPAYMFALDEYDRPTGAARLQQAEMTACAIAGSGSGSGAGSGSVAGSGAWKCPILHLAEREGKTIRVTARADGPLMLDPADPFGAGKQAGFALTGCANGATIRSVAIAGDDPQTILITLSKVPEGDDLRLAYACAGQTGGALRDLWRMDSATGSPLHRWALPAHLPVTGGRNA